MQKIKVFCWLPLLLGLAACTSVKHSPAMKTGQTAQKLSIERKQVLATDYLLFLPQDYDASSSKRWPLILFLHGAGERGANIWRVATHGPPKIDTMETNFPFIVVSPQCADGKMWADDLLIELLDEVESKYAVDTNRVYLTGISMGGFGTWNLGLSHPERFAAMAPVCGGGETILLTLAHLYDPAQLARIRSLGVWAFHGGKDTTVLPGESARMVEALKRIGCTDVKLTIYPDAGHDSWNQAYADPDLFKWFLQHSR